MSEVAKYRHLIEPYCQGCVLDVGSQGAPGVPWAWSLDLPQAEFAHYNSNNPPNGPIQLRGHAERIPIESDSLDALISSHLLEDFLHWKPVISEWVRVIRKGGYLVVLIPDKVRWNEAIRKGQPPNNAHVRESYPGELSTYAAGLGIEVICDKLTDLTPEDYTIMFVGRKV